MTHIWDKLFIVAMLKARAMKSSTNLFRSYILENPEAAQLSIALRQALLKQAEGKIRVHQWLKKGRTLTCASDQVLHGLERAYALQLQCELVKSGSIHPLIYAACKGRGSVHFIWLTIMARRLGLWTLRVDLRSAFSSVDIARAIALLRRALKNSPLKDITALPMLVNKHGKECSGGGLAQGMPQSPALFGMYLTPVMRRMNKKFLCASYVDDMQIWVRSPSEKDEALDCLRWAFAKHSSRSKRLTIHEHGKKEPRIYGPDELLPILGVALKSTTIVELPDHLRDPGKDKPAGYKTFLEDTIRAVSRIDDFDKGMDQIRRFGPPGLRHAVIRGDGVSASPEKSQDVLL